MCLICRLYLHILVTEYPENDVIFERVFSFEKENPIDLE